MSDTVEVVTAPDRQAAGRAVAAEGLRYPLGMHGGSRSKDTGIGGGQGRFPVTRLSLVAALASPDASERKKSFDVLVAAYWKPVYKHIRIRWNRSNEDAKDLTQGFFLRALEKEFFAKYDPAKARFRTFLRTCLDGYVANEDKAVRARKRGGDVELVSLDFDAAEGEIARATLVSRDDAERAFEAEWLRGLLGLAIEALRADCATRGHEVSFRLFERYDLWEGPDERPTYERLASELSLPVPTVTNHLRWARREFRRVLLEKLREITVTEDEFRREAREVLGEEPS